jgi:integrase
LRWQDVDLDTGTLRVRQIVQRVDMKLIIEEPKTVRSRRTLTMPEVVNEEFRHHRDRQAFDSGGAQRRGEELTFGGPEGGSLSPDSVRRRFKATVASAGDSEQRFHDLRHYAATFMVVRGVPMRVVMAILGHSQMSTTIDLHAHVMPAAHREVANLFAEAIRVQR